MMKRGFLAAAVLLAALLTPVSARLARAQASRSRVVFQNVVVKRGDTLWSIANTYLKDPAKWNEILKYNRLPSSDPTVALPGMTLRVPLSLIKESMQAANLTEKIHSVYFRRRNTASWNSARQDMQLFQGDSLRTMADSKARVKFLAGGLLAIDANSMAIIQPPMGDYDLQLEKGSVFVGRARVVTESARIEPKTKDTQYLARVRDDLSTEVEVYRGRAAVSAQGQTVVVGAGMESLVRMGLAPEVPKKITDMTDLEDRSAFLTGGGIRQQVRVKGGLKEAQIAQGALAAQVNSAADAADISGDVNSLKIGVPISAYRVQASLSPSFDKLAYNKVFDADEKFNPAETGLSAGVYWWRIALIDLLGTQENFSTPRLYSVGLGRQTVQGVDLTSSVSLLHPAQDEFVSSPDYRVSGVIKSDQVSVTVNGEAVREDEDGNFFANVKLIPGPNSIKAVVSDGRGNSTTITRRVTYTPASDSE